MQAPAPSPTRQRLLEAATRVFARSGLAGATTRAIAEEAGVNEVTLFRHFQSKDRLLAAVVGQNFGPSSAAEAAPLPPATDDLRADLLALGQRQEKLFKDNLPLVRTMIGEIHHHHRDQEHQVFKSIFLPLKAATYHRIETAQAAGELTRDMRADVLGDLFGAMIFTGVLRRSGTHAKLDYSAANYLESAVELVLRGATSRKAGA